MNGFCNDCEYLKDSSFRGKHFCDKYKRYVKHLRKHREIVRLEECVIDTLQYIIPKDSIIDIKYEVECNLIINNFSDYKIKKEVQYLPNMEFRNKYKLYQEFIENGIVYLLIQYEVNCIEKTATLTLEEKEHYINRRKIDVK